MNITIPSFIIGFTYFSNILFSIIVIYYERKKPMISILWILTFIFIPFLGFLFYLLFGRNLRPDKKKIFKLKKEYDNMYKNWLTYEKHLVDNGEISFSDENTSKYLDILKMNINSCNSIYTQDNDIQMFKDGKSKYDSLFNDIKNAKETINILYYIINNDNVGKKLIELLTIKANEGVEVRLLYDHLGSFFTPFTLYNDLIKAGGKVSRFFPIKLGTILRINFRNHRKIVIIDGAIGYIGGMNIGDEYMGLNPKLSPWRDTHLRLVGSSVGFLQERFLMDWYYATSEQEIHEDSLLKKFFVLSQGTGDIGVQIISSGPDSTAEQIKRSYIKMISSAKKNLFIQSPYFVPDESFLEALQIASMSGVDVRVMLPAKPDKKFVYHATTSYIRDLLEHGIKVYLYPGFIHSKMLLVDDGVVSIGTANMDIRSFALDFEINAIIYNSKFTELCSDAFEDDVNISSLVTRDLYNSRSLIIKISEGISRLLSPLL